MSLRTAVADSLARRYGATGVDPAAVLPTIGSKEMVAWLPTLLGLGAGDIVVIPELAYPTYEVGARLAGADHVRSDSLTAAGPGRVKLVWLNSPSNPTGRVLPVEHLRKVVTWARERGAVVASDECYLGLPGTSDPAPRSVLHPDVCDGDHTGLLAVHSLSKTSNTAGYRAAYVAGDPALVAALLEVRKHAGMIVPRPVQAGAGGRRLRRRARRRAGRALRRAARPAARRARGVRAARSSTRSPGCTCGAPRARTAGRPWTGWPSGGSWWPPASSTARRARRHVRVALTATDERIDAAVARLGS